MTETEVKGLWARLTAAWPKQTITPPTMQVWAEHMRPLNFTIVADAVRDLEASCKWFPALAEFTECYHRAADRARHDNANERGLAAGGTTAAPRSTVQRVIDECRRKIDAAIQLQPKSDFERRLDPRAVVDEMTEDA